MSDKAAQVRWFRHIPSGGGPYDIPAEDVAYIRILTNDPNYVETTANGFPLPTDAAKPETYLYSLPEVGKTIKRLRLAAGYGVRSFCKLIGILPSELEAFERGVVSEEQIVEALKAQRFHAQCQADATKPSEATNSVRPHGDSVDCEVKVGVGEVPDTSRLPPGHAVGQAGDGGYYPEKSRNQLGALLWEFRRSVAAGGSGNDPVDKIHAMLRQAYSTIARLGCELREAEAARTAVEKESVEMLNSVEAERDKALEQLTVAASSDSNVRDVCQKLIERSRVGLRRYGVTTERTDLSLSEWLTHLQHELLDASVYAQRLLNGPLPAAQPQAGEPGTGNAQGG
jgi:hypothetical protein